MLLCGSLFLTIAVWARKITVATQLCVVDLVKHLRGTMDTSRTVVTLGAKVVENAGADIKPNGTNDEETVQLTKLETGMHNEPKTID